MSTTHSGIPGRSSSYSAYDPLAEFEAREDRAFETRQTWRLVGGVLLAGAGLGLCLWLAWTVHAALFRPDKLAILQRLVPSQPADLVLTIPQGKIELPPAVMPVIAYVLLIALAGIGARIAAALLKEGVGLLRYEPPTDVVVEPASPAPLSTRPHDGG